MKPSFLYTEEICGFGLVPYNERSFEKMMKINTNLSPPREGDLFKVIELHGVTFEIKYGYYEDIDRKYDPVEIYPDFKKNPVYTSDGYPFITLMQSPCEHFKRMDNEVEQDCGSCKYMERGDELIAICKCGLRKKENSIH